MGIAVALTFKISILGNETIFKVNELNDMLEFRLKFSNRSILLTKKKKFFVYQGFAFCQIDEY